MTHESKQFTARLDPDLDTWVRRRAMKNNRSINQEINKLLGTLKRLEEHRNERAVARTTAQSVTPSTEIAGATTSC